jgi:hypothetical protein
MVELHRRIALTKRVCDVAGIGRHPAFSGQRIADQGKVAEGRAVTAGNCPLLVGLGKNIKLEHYALSYHASLGRSLANAALHLSNEPDRPELRALLAVAQKFRIAA